MRALSGILVVAVAGGAILGGFALATSRSVDTYKVVLGNAVGLVSGSPVQLDGFDVGEVTGVSARDDKAVAEFAVRSLPRPLTTGSTVVVEWRSEIGERYLQIRPGPAGNPVLPDGAILESGPPQVLLGELVQSLDAPTRAHLTSFLREIDTTLDGHQEDLNQTLRAAGPAMGAFGGALDAIGADGQAIKTVLSNLRQVTDVLAARRASLSDTVTELDQFTRTAAVHQQQLGDGLKELPSTLDAVRAALDKVPAAAEQTVPLLQDLRPAAERLPGGARDLNPVLTRLRPVMARLGPTLDAADDLFGPAPDFLRKATDVLPQLRTTLHRVTPALDYLRPYTPEALGTVTTFGNLMAGYDAQGHFLIPLVTEGKQALTANPPVTTPGESVRTGPVPGSVVGQPWTDAGGSGPR